jgi:RNA polymerase sigma-70 factor (ECF subfamily)
VELYTPLIQSWLRHFGTPSADVDDLVQEVLCVVVKQIPHFQDSQQRGAFRRWLRTIAFNHAQINFRARGKNSRDCQQHVETIPDPATDPDRRWEREHDEYVIRRLFEMLRPEFTATTWQAFQRQVLDNFTPAQTASELGISVNAALIAKSRVHRRLRQESRGLVD